MKKVLGALLVLVAYAACLAGSAATSYISATADTRISQPKNVTIIKLGNCYSSSTDTIGAGYSNMFGPYSLTPAADGSRARFMGFRCISALNALPATCTTSVDYQILGSTVFADTQKTKWVAFDSIKAAAGNSGGFIKLDSLPGAAIVFRLHCLANSSTAIVAKPVRIIFTNTASDYIDTKK
jgi:hypothetical protein